MEGALATSTAGFEEMAWAQTFPALRVVTKERTMPKNSPA
jgi:hypothetical protein